MSAEARIKPSPPIEISATLDNRSGACTVATARDRIAIGTASDTTASSTPVELLCASLASCLALSIRIAAHSRGLSDALAGVTVAVRGHKAKTLPSRLQRLEAAVTMTSMLDRDQQEALLRHGERICTVSNTLHGAPVEIAVTLA